MSLRVQHPLPLITMFRQSHTCDNERLSCLLLTDGLIGELTITFTDPILVPGACGRQSGVHFPFLGDQSIANRNCCVWI